MLTMLQNWQGKVQINGTVYDSIQAFTTLNKPLTENIHIVLYTNEKTAEKPSNTKSEQEYRITVKPWMTKKTEYDAFGNTTFDFMAKWNNDIPMPLVTMTGKILKETPGMYKMELHGDIYAEKICTCMKCGRVLKNKVSQYFGIGPECGGHGYVNPFESEDELKEAVSAYKRQLQNTTWTGWVVKSAIKEMVEV